MSHSRRDRIEKVAFLLRQGNSKTQIAKLLGVNRKTVFRDEMYLKAASQRWLSDLASGDFVFEVKMIYDKLRDSERHLRKMFEDTQIDAQSKLKALKQFDENLAHQFELLNGGPVYSTIKKKLDEYNKWNKP